jgi:epoxide hydrolase 4
MTRAARFRYDPTAETHVNATTTMSEELVDLGAARQNVKVNVASAGPVGGRPVLLLHGFPETWWSWRHQIGPLASAGFRVLAADLRGSGKSDVRGPYDLATLADDAAALIRLRHGDRPTDVVGHDWGGATAWTLARRHPQLVRKLIILNSCLPERAIDAMSVRPSPRQILRSWYILLLQIPWLPELLLARRGAAMVRSIIRSGAGGPRALTDEEMQPFCDAALREGGARGMLGPYRHVLRRALRDLLRSGDPFPERGAIACPTLLLWGDNDPAQGFDQLVPGSHGVVPGLRVIRLPRCGHFPHSEAPDTVNPQIIDFL